MFEGVGPAVGKSVQMFFDFTDAQNRGGPPVGANTIVPGRETTGDLVSDYVSLALGANDQPMIAYVANNKVRFMSWDQVAKAWKTPVTLDTENGIAGTRPVWFAYDSKTQLLGIAYTKDIGNVWLALSTNGGATWVKEAVTNPNRGGYMAVAHPILAMRDGVIHLGYLEIDAFRCNVFESCGDLRYQTRRGTSGPFSVTTAPLLPGTRAVPDESFGLALDSSGRPGLVAHHSSFDMPSLLE